MNVTKKLISILAAGATLVVAAPVFADSGRDRGYGVARDHRYYRNYDRRDYREHYRDYNRRQIVVVRRPVIIERPVYYAEPAPIGPVIIERPAYYAEPAPIVYGIGPAAIIGAAIGGIIDSRR